MIDEDRFGFRWGQVVVARIASIRRDPKSKNSEKVIRITPDEGKYIEIYVSPTGRSIRVFKGHKEMFVK